MRVESYAVRCLPSWKLAAEPDLTALRATHPVWLLAGYTPLWAAKIHRTSHNLIRVRATPQYLLRGLFTAERRTTSLSSLPPVGESRASARVGRLCAGRPSGQRRLHRVVAVLAELLSAANLSAEQRSRAR